MRTQKLVAVCLLFCLTAAHGGEIYKWTDEHGKVHFSDVKPAAGKATVAPVEMKLHRPTEQEIREAEARAAKEKSLPKPAGGGADAPGAKSAALKSPAPAEDKSASCEAQWKKYQESSACFETYRQANGSVRAEAYQRCTEVKTPEKCQ